MTFIFIDRRKSGKAKSSPNRQKLIKRIRNFIKTSQPNSIGSSSVTNSNKNLSPVHVAGEALEEPWFAYSRDGERVQIIIGNTEYDRGDVIDMPSSSSGGKSNSGGSGDGGEDDFTVNIARDEFLDLFFEDCELPNLSNEKYTEKLDNKFQPAGFSTNGTPAQLSIIRTYKQSLGRRKALMGPYQEEKEQLEAELSHIKEMWAAIVEDGKVLESEIRVDEIEVRLAELSAKFNYLDNFDKSDLRYRKKEAKPLKTVDAVLIMLMDVSGSMDENKKTIARRWFALLYAFIKRRYASTELVFIAHTDEVFEMSEENFFNTRVNGGTQVSPALKMVNDLIRSRYDTSQTNIYVCHASDGDNSYNDNDAVCDEMTGSTGLLNKVQFFSYVEVGKPFYAWQTKNNHSTSLWDSYEQVRESSDQSKITMSILETADDCYDVFKSVFKKSS